jgi:Ser/Thr protein kinase RdoA (MazF antagonist)
VGAFHRTWRERRVELAGVRRRVPLLRHDAVHLTGLGTRVRAVRRSTAVEPGVIDVVGAWSRAVRDLLAVQPTVVHGECYASNVLVDDGGRVAVVDWETTAIGSGWGDLAALVVGWDRSDREVFLEDYLGAVGHRDDDAAAERLLDAARLGNCIQWLGADPGWAPPSEQQRDWLADALEILDEARWPW